MIPTAEDLRAGDLEDARDDGNLVTLRVAITRAEGDPDSPVGPRIVHEVAPEDLLDFVAETEQIDGDTFPRFELGLWIENEAWRWPLDVIAIPRDLADVLLEGRLDEYLTA